MGVVKQAMTKKSKLVKLEKASKVKKPKEIKHAKTKLPSKKIVEVPTKVENNVASRKSSFVMPSKYITENLVSSCLNALEQLTESQKKKNTILDDEQAILAEIHCIKIQKSTGNLKFVLPHSTAATTGEICLITPDLKKGRKIDHEPTIEHWEDKLRSAGVKNVKTILPVRQLKVEYDQFELQRRLLTQHDFIMVDTRVLSHVSHLLGKKFFKKHNMLIPVRIREDGDLKKSIELGLRTVMLRLNEGDTSAIVVGHTGMPKEHVKQNVLGLVKQLCDRFPGGEANIRKLSLKLPLSLSLPLYITLRPSNIINIPKLSQRKPKNFTVVEDELTTQLHSTVRVAPDGTVHLLRSQGNVNSDDEDYDDVNMQADNDNAQALVKVKRTMDRTAMMKIKGIN